MTELQRVIPDPETLLTLEPEELGAHILLLFDHYVQNGLFHRQSVRYFEPVAAHVGRHPRYDEVDSAIAEAIQWLELAGLIVPDTGVNGANGWRRLTRRGRRLKASPGLLRAREAALLPRAMLHQSLDAEVWPLFIRGDHEIAVFAAFRTVEIAVRTASAQPDTATGVPLMRTAFHPTTGPLRDPNAPAAETEATMHLFSGAFGSIRNPVGHRQVGLTASKGAAEMIILASYLLRIVDERIALRANNAPVAARGL